MSAMATALAVSAPLMLAADERGRFHFPRTEDAFRLQKIERKGEQEWPFAATSGHLMCVWVLGQKVVYFAETLGGDRKEPRVLVVSTNPFDLMVVNAGSSAMFTPYDDLEQLIVRLAPFESLGRRLCDQPRGTEVGPSEL